MSKLRAYVNEIESVFAEIDVLSDRKREIYNRAHRDKLDKTALRQVIEIRRKWGANPPEFEKRDTIVMQYLAELNGLGSIPLTRARARGAK